VELTEQMIHPMPFANLMLILVLVKEMNSNVGIMIGKGKLVHLFFTLDVLEIGLKI